MPVFAACDANLPLKSAPIDGSWITGGQPVAMNRVLSTSTDGSSWTMLWSCTPGSFRWRYSFDETIHFLEGAVTIRAGDGTTRRYGAGDMLFFPAGAVADWQIERSIKKLAFCQVPAPVLLRLPMKAWRRLAIMASSLRRLLQIHPANPALDEPADEQKTQGETAPASSRV